VFLVAILSVPLLAQEKLVAFSYASPQKIEAPTRLPADSVAFFYGDWAGVGEFASGKKIEADVSFTRAR